MVLGVRILLICLRQWTDFPVVESLFSHPQTNCRTWLLFVTLYHHLPVNPVWCFHVIILHHEKLVKKIETTHYTHEYTNILHVLKNTHVWFI